MNKKEKLKKQLEEIEKQERDELIEKEYPKFKELIGKCFKYKNSYSCPVKPSDYWYTYFKITSINPSDLYLGGVDGNKVLCCCSVLRFEKDKNGVVMFDPNYSSYIHSLGEQIDELEYTKALSKVMNSVNEMINMNYE